MNNKTTAIIVTVLAVLLCACPGLTGLCMGGMFAVISFVPGANIDIGGSNDPKTALNTGIAGLCFGIVFILIAALVIYFVWKRKKAEMLPPSPSEPLPPAS